MSRLWTKGILGLAAFAAVALVGQRAEAAYINVFDGCLEGSANTVNCNGTRAGDADGTLTTSPEWADSYLAWTVDFDPATNLYRYTYTFEDTGATFAQAASHSIIELSASFTITNLKGGTCSGASIGTFGVQGNSNPGLPADFYGVKCNGTQADPYIVVLVTDRAPMWGDWYAKDGDPVHAYNAGFLVADPIASAPTDGSLLNHVLVPDTLTVTPQCPTFDCDVTAPEPVSLALFGLVLTAAGYVGRRRFNS